MQGQKRLLITLSLSRAVKMIILFGVMSTDKQPQICNGTGQILHLVVCAGQLYVLVSSSKIFCLLITKAFMEFATSKFFLLRQLD
jgi:hypothetical protein